MLGLDRNREVVFLLALLVVSLVLRVSIVRTDRVVRWDEPDYLIAGRNLFTGKGYAVTSRPEIHYAPLFPVVTGSLYALTHDMKMNSDIVYILFGTLALLPCYWLSRQTFGRPAAVMAATFMCVFPSLTSAVLFWGTMLEPLYLFLLYGALCCVWHAWEHQKTTAYLAAGALFGLAYLTKPEAIVYLVVMFGLLALGMIRRSFLSRRQAAGRLAAGLLAFALVVSPYLAFLYRHTGRLLVTGKLGVTYVAGLGAVVHDPGMYDRALSRLDAAGEEIIWFSEDRFQYSIWDEVAADAGGFLRRIWMNVNALESALLARDVFPVYLLLLLGLAWFASPWNEERAWKEAFLAAAVAPTAVFLPFHIELRYFAPVFPVLLLWLARGVLEFGDWLQQTCASWQSKGRCTRASVTSVLLIGSVLTAYFLILQPRVLRKGLANMNLSRREAGLWLRENSPADSLIMSRDPEVPFYADRRWVASPNEEFSRFVAYVRKRGADYLVVDEREATVVRPQLSFLMDQGSSPAGLVRLYTAADPRGKTVVFRVEY